MFVCERNTEYLDAISRLKVIDDDFMRIVFKDKECLTQFLEIILERPIEIIEWHVQYDINNILGRSISIDVFVKTENHYINIEVQRDYTGANPRRARFHGSLIDDFDMCAGKCLVEALQVWNEKIAADRVARSYTDLTACGSSVQELGLALLDQIHGGLNMAHQDFALRSELHLFCTSYKQGLVQFAFQSLYRLADSGLGNKKAFGRLRKVQC